MPRKTATAETALEVFEARKAAIVRKAVKFSTLLQEYDRTISTVMGGHKDWAHAGTLGNVDELLQKAISLLIEATAKTKVRAAFRRAK